MESAEIFLRSSLTYHVNMMPNNDLAAVTYFTKEVNTILAK